MGRPPDTGDPGKISPRADGGNRRLARPGIGLIHEVETWLVYLRGGRSRRVLCSVRMFGFPELRDWLRAAGCGEVAGYGEDGQPLTAESRWMMVAGRV